MVDTDLSFHPCSPDGSKVALSVTISVYTNTRTMTYEDS